MISKLFKVIGPGIKAIGALSAVSKPIPVGKRLMSNGVFPPSLKSFIPVPKNIPNEFVSDDSHFTIQNVPFCSAKIQNHVTGLDEFRIFTRIGSKFIDVKGLVDKGFFNGFSQSISNALMQPNCDSLIHPR